MKIDPALNKKNNAAYKNQLLRLWDYVYVEKR